MTQTAAPMVQPTAPAKKKTVMPLIGGALMIVAAAIELYYGALLVGASTAADILPIAGDWVEDILVVCGALAIIFGIITLMGGVFAIMRKHFGLAVLGGIFSLLGWFIPGLIGLILVAISKDEFE